MAKKEIFTGVDLGSSHFRVVIGEETESGFPLRIIGVGVVPSSGVRRGTVTNPEDAAKAFLAALDRAEHMSGARVESVTVALSGADMFCGTSSGVVAIGRADGEVVADDVERVLGEAHARATLSPNQDILHVFPQGFRLDDQKNLRDPIGLKGVRLEVSALVIGMGSMPSRNASRLFEIAKTNLEFIVVAPLSAAQAVLSEQQKDLGVVMVTIGSGATSLSVFEEGELLHVAAIPIGGGHITNDIAIGLRTSIEVAEAVKLSYGHALPESIDRREEIDLSKFDTHEDGVVSRRHIAEIIEARLEEIFRFVNDELKKIHKEGLLPGGVVLTGGTALLPGAIELGKDILRLPVHVGYPEPLGGIFDQVDAPDFSVAVGALLLARDHGKGGVQASNSGVIDFMPKIVVEWGKKVRSLSDRFLP
jgi:cell division protein FtsA